MAVFNCTHGEPIGKCCWSVDKRDLQDALGYMGEQRARIAALEKQVAELRGHLKCAFVYLNAPSNLRNWTKEAEAWYQSARRACEETQ